MRRVVSISVLVVLLASVLVPLAQANLSWVPACCRAGGQHRCMGMAGMDGFHSLPTKCPYRVAPAVTSGIAALVTVSLPVSIFVAECQAAVLPACEPVPVAFGNVQKRGPPVE
jgi:hypothetical protein